MEIFVKLKYLYNTITSSINYRINNYKQILEMLAIKEVVTDIYAEVKCKISDCIVNKPMHICYIYAERFRKNGVFITIYKHQTLAQLYIELAKAIQIEEAIKLRDDIPLTISNHNNNNKQTSKMVELVEFVEPVESTDTVEPERDFNIINKHSIRDVFICNSSGHGVTSIPCDEDVTLIEFIMLHSDNFKLTYSPFAKCMVYKLAIIDNDYLQTSGSSKI
jgi:hypothetical protein